MYYNLIINALFIGILTVIIGVIVGYVFAKYEILNVYIPDNCSHWNDNHVMEMSLFVTGFILYIIITLIQLWL